MPTLRLTSLGEVTLGVFNVHDLVMAVNELWPVVRILDVKRKVSSYEFLIAFLMGFYFATPWKAALSGLRSPMPTSKASSFWRTDCS